MGINKTETYAENQRLKIVVEYRAAGYPDHIKPVS